MRIRDAFRYDVYRAELAQQDGVLWTAAARYLVFFRSAGPASECIIKRGTRVPGRPGNVVAHRHEPKLRLGDPRVRPCHSCLVRHRKTGLLALALLRLVAWPPSSAFGTGHSFAAA